MKPSSFPRLLALLFLVVAGSLASCSSAPPFDAKAVVREWRTFMDQDYILRGGDKITISIFQNEELSQELIVSPNGMVALKRLPSAVRASGKTIGAFRREVQAAYAKFLNNPEVTVSLTEAALRSVYVAGEVKSPGPIPYVQGMILSQAIAAAGGLDITAKWSDVRVLRNNGRGRDHTYRVNADTILHDGTPDFLVLPGDVVYAQTSGIADVGNWVELYIRRILPVPITGLAVPTK
jgi:polysaccharide export outer membrane protein